MNFDRPTSELDWYGNTAIHQPSFAVQGTTLKAATG
jgi:hypothetical protein